VSNEDPNVEIVSTPFAGAVNFHHTDFPPEYPAWLGSPDCFVALRFVPETVVDEVGSAVADANASLAGGSGVTLGAVPV
jgi:hypothetical protein